MNSSGLHRDALAHPTDVAEDTLHTLGYIVATVSGLDGIFTATEGKSAWVQSTNEFYVYNSNGVWIYIGGGSGSSSHEPFQEITALGATILNGITKLNITGDGTASVDPSIPIQAHMRIFNVQYAATVYAPAGWSFSDGSTNIVLGLWASAILSYYGDQVIIIDSQSPGVTP